MIRFENDRLIHPQILPEAEQHCAVTLCNLDPSLRGVKALAMTCQEEVLQLRHGDLGQINEPWYIMLYFTTHIMDHHGISYIFYYTLTCDVTNHPQFRYFRRLHWAAHLSFSNACA